jgi:hypothetical protein
MPDRDRDARIAEAIATAIDPPVEGPSIGTPPGKTANRFTAGQGDLLRPEQAFRFRPSFLRVVRIDWF